MITAQDARLEESLGNLKRGQKVNRGMRPAMLSHLHKSPRTDLRAEHQRSDQEEEVLMPDERTHKVRLILSLLTPLPAARSTGLGSR